MTQTELELLITAKTEELRTEMSKVQTQLDRLTAKQEKAAKTFSKGFKDALPDVSKFGLGLAAAGVAMTALNSGIQSMVAKEKSLAEFSAITGVTGAKLQEFGDIATELSNQFGTSTVDNIETFKGVLSRLGPDFASSSEAVRIMGENINTLAVASGLDATQAMDALTTAMLQFGVSLDDPNEAARISTEMMDVMAAGAKEGAAEIPQIAEALKQVGVTAKGLNVSFLETNAMIQTLALAGKVGSEAGVSLRNVLTSLTSATGPGTEALSKMGLSVTELSAALTSGDENAANNALTMLRVGLEKLPNAGERAAVMVKIFGKENMAAAGALIAGTDATGKFTESMKEVGVAAGQSEIILNTMDGRWRQATAFLENTGVAVLEKIKTLLAGVVGAIESLIDGVVSIATLDWDGIEKAGSKALMGLGDMLDGATGGIIKMNDWLGLNAKETENASEKMGQAIANNTQEMFGKIEQAATPAGRSVAQMKAELEALQTQFGEAGNAAERSKLVPKINALKKEIEDIEGVFSKKKGKQSTIAGSIGAINEEARKLTETLTTRMKMGSEEFLSAAIRAERLNTQVKIANDGVKVLSSQFGLVSATAFSGFDQAEVKIRSIAHAIESMSAGEISPIEQTALDIEHMNSALALSERTAQNVEAAVGGLGQAFTMAFQGGEDSMKAMMKQILNSIIDFISIQFIAAQAAATIRAFMTFGMSALADTWGWIAAAGALGLAKAAVASFAVGTANVPRDMPAMVHEGETIVPKTFADSIRSGELALVGSDRTKAYVRKGSRTQTIKAKISRSSFDSDVGAAMYEGSRGMK